MFRSRRVCAGLLWAYALLGEDLIPYTTRCQTTAAAISQKLSILGDWIRNSSQKEDATRSILTDHQDERVVGSERE